MTPVSRRSFLQAATLGAASLGRFPLAARARQGAQAAPVPSAAAAGRTLKLGLIGCGWYGMVDVKAAFKVGGVEVIGVCDVDSEHLAQSRRRDREDCRAARPRTFKHYADLLALPGLDAVIIATPPQWHALQLIAASSAASTSTARSRSPTTSARAGPWSTPWREAAASCRSASSAGRARRSRPCGSTSARAGRENRLRRGEDPLHGRHEGPDAAGAARLARLGPLVRPRAHDSLQPAGRPHELAAGEDHRARPPRGLGHPPHRRGAHDPGRGHAEVGLGHRRPLRTPRQDHHAGRADGALRIRDVPADVATPDLGRGGVHARGLQRHLLLRREGDDLRHRRPLGHDPEGQDQPSAR